MVVTEIIELPQGKKKIFIDEEFAFVLYKGELRLYGIVLDEEVSLQNYQKIVTEVLPKRAKNRSLYLLQDREYTEWKLREKLRRGFYTEDVIDVAISYVKSYQYIDDERFTRNYISCYIKRKSKKMITNLLYQKGISKEVIYASFESLEEEGVVENQWELINRELQKRGYDKNNTDEKKKQKVISSLYRKGYSIDIIKNVLKL